MAVCDGAGDPLASRWPSRCLESRRPPCTSSRTNSATEGGDAAPVSGQREDRELRDWLRIVGSALLIEGLPQGLPLVG